MNQKLSSITIILLSYNERENLEPIVLTALATAKKIASAHEIFIVQYEGSTDGSITEARRLSKKHPTIKIFLQPKNERGYGRALSIGMAHATKDWIFYTDSDGQFNIQELERFIPYMTATNIIAGWRKNRKDQFGRLLAAEVYNLLMKITFGIRHPDVDCAFRLLKRKTVNSYPMISKTGLYVTELLVWEHEKENKIVSLPVHHYHRRSGEATFQNKIGFPKLGVIIGLLKEYSALRKKVKEEREVQR